MTAQIPAGLAAQYEAAVRADVEWQREVLGDQDAVGHESLGFQEPTPAEVAAEADAMPPPAADYELSDRVRTLLRRHSCTTCSGIDETTLEDEDDRDAVLYTPAHEQAFGRGGEV